MSVMKLPDSCPSCSGSMMISELTCSECGSQVKGSFTPHPFRMVSGAQRAFMETFIVCRGNIREVEKKLGVSYPTVRNRLNEVILALSEVRLHSRDCILDALESGAITAERAADLIELL
jgi:hypothetical protein